MKNEETIIEKEKVTICYDGSGIKTLRVLSILSMIFGVVSILAGFIIGIESDIVVLWIIGGTGGGLVWGVFSAGCSALATIAETALIKKTILIRQYDIAMVEKTEMFGE